MAWIDKKLVLMLLLITIWAAAVRLQYLPYIQVYSDSLSPYLGALGALHQGWAEAPNPESDHWLWITAFPSLLICRDLYELFFIRCLIAALIAPIGAFSAYVLAAKYRYTAAFMAGGLLAMDKGLIDTLISSFRGYMAPEWVALATLSYALCLRGKYVALPAVVACSVIAGGHHPMALGTLLAAAAAVFIMQREYGWKILWPVFMVSVIVALPRVWSMWQLAQCDAGGLACFQQVAWSSSESLDTWVIVKRAFHERISADWGWGAIGIFLGIALACREKFGLWAGLALCGVVVLGLSISTLRPYHLRIVAAPLAVWAAVGLAKLGGWAIPIFVVSLGALWGTTEDISGRSGDIQKHDEAAQAVRQLNLASGWVEGVFDEDGQRLSPAGVVLSALLQGEPNHHFPSVPKGTIMVFSEQAFGTRGRVMAQGSGWVLQDIGPAEQVKEWSTKHAVQLGGAHDWVIRLYPAEKTELWW